MDLEAVFEKQIELNKQPLIDNRNLLEDQLSEKIDAEEDLNNARVIVEKIENELTLADQARLQKERAVNEARIELNESKENLQTIKIRREGLDEQLVQADYNYEDLLDEIIAGVRSSFTYAGATSISDFADRAVVGIQSASGYAEGRPLHTSW
mgnify:CR=1 FL=1